jgi:two-component system chemotaxis sensor kinase CheA
MEAIEAEQIGTSLDLTVEWTAGRERLITFLADNHDIVAYELEELALAEIEARAVAPTDDAIVERPVGRRKPPRTANTIRVSVERIDRMLDFVGELVIERSRIADSARNLQARFGASPEIERLIESTSQIELLISQVHEELMLGRMLPIESVLGRFPRLARDLAQSLDKEVDFELDSGEVELDRSVIEAIGDPLIHIVRNAVDHGIEAPDDREAAGKPRTGRVAITARQIESRIVVEVSDDGKGIDANALRMSAVEKGVLSEEAAARLSDAEAINLVFHSGLSTAEEVTGVSGRGVGMDIVRKNLENIGGTIEIQSTPGQGSVLKIRLPLTLAIIRALLVRCDRWTFAMPLDAVIETVRLSDMQVHTVGQRHALKLRDRIIPVMHLSDSLAQSRHADGDTLDSGFGVVMNIAGNPVAVLVDSLVGEQEVVVKPFGAYIPPVPGISGATILGDGAFALIVDVGRLASLEGAEHATTYAA